MKKYAAPSKPVVLAVDRQAQEIRVLISNFIGKNAAATESTGIGIPTVRRLAAENGGRVEISQTKERFSVQLTFPIHDLILSRDMF